jgi:hypothetical protein
MITKKVHSNEPLCQEQKEKLLQYMTEQGLSRAGLGRFMGYKESSFRSIMNGRNTIRKNHELIKKFVELVIDGDMAPEDFLKSQNAVEGVSLPSTRPKLDSGDEAGALGITGDERPILPTDTLEERVQSISQTAENLELLLEPFLNDCGIGDRRLLRVKTGNTLTRLLTLLRGASSEAVLKKMIADDPDVFVK